MKTITNDWQYLPGGLYTWSITTFFGAILLDVVYFNIINSALKPSETATIFSQGADFLLIIGTLTIPAAIGAIGSAWRLRAARNLFIASFFFGAAIEFLLPILFFSLFQKAQVNLGFNVGPWIRLITSALSSILAFAGLWKICASTS